MRHCSVSRTIPTGRRSHQKWWVTSSHASASSSRLSIQGQTFTVIGAAGELPKPPEKPIVFLEGEIKRRSAHTRSSNHPIYAPDMDDAEMAEAVMHAVVHSDDSLTPL